MVSFLKNYKAIGIALVITIILKNILEYFRLISIDPNEIVENILGFVFWWLAISFNIHKIPYLKRNSAVAYKILALIIILILAIVVDSSLKIPDNPITLPLIILFWLGSGSLLLPNFFKKYRIPIIILYSALIGFFLYIRLSSGYFEKYDGTIVNLIIASILLLLTLWVFEQWKWLRAIKSERTNAELALLKSQINPHFFFNTLNNLYGLTVEKSDRAPEVVLKLSEMMRYTIYEGKKTTVKLEDEIIYLNNYIELQKLRYQKRVDVTFEHSSDKDYEITPLLFIILMENAFKHGVESVMKDAFVQLCLKANDGVVIFESENNFEISKIEKSAGIGLENLKRRLNLIYPNKYRLDINQSEQTFRAVLKIELK